MDTTPEMPNLSEIHIPTIGGVPLFSWAQTAGLVVGLVLTGQFSGGLVGMGVAWLLDKQAMATKGEPLLTL